MNIDQLRAMRDALLSRIASGERWNKETRRQYSILVAGILALEIKQRQAA